MHNRSKKGGQRYIPTEIRADLGTGIYIASIEGTTMVLQLMRSIALSNPNLNGGNE
jgi:hypothetical protein